MTDSSQTEETTATNEDGDGANEQRMEEDGSVSSDLSKEGRSRHSTENEKVEEVEVEDQLGPVDVIGGRTLANQMTEEQAEVMEKALHSMLDDFES